MTTGFGSSWEFLAVLTLWLLALLHRYVRRPSHDDEDVGILIFEIGSALFAVAMALEARRFVPVAILVLAPGIARELQRVASGPYRGKFWHRPPGEEPRPIDVPNTYATELSLDRRTVLLKLHGAVDPFPDREWESFVITEDDYIDYLGRSDLVSAVPVALAAHLRRSHFLFIGYEMVDWNLRLVMHRVWGDRPLAYRSWALDPEPSALEQAFWRRFDVDVLDVDPDEYVGLLERRLEGVP